MIPPSNLKKLITNELARRELRYFVKAIKPDYIFSKFSLDVCAALDEFLNDVRAGKRPILLVEAFPQSGKSLLCSRMFPAYCFGLNPDWRIGGCSYSADWANSLNRDVQRIMLGDEYKEIFPESALKETKAKDMSFRTSERFDIVGHNGYYVSCGVRGSLTGKSLDIGIIDDPIKDMVEAQSATTKEAILSWYNTVFKTRLSKQSGHIIMMTRWAIDDLIGIVKEKKRDNVKILSFPAIINGESLVPELHPIDKLLETKELISAYEWSALYMQSPTIKGGNLIKTEQFIRYDIAPEKYDRMYIVADTAFTEKTSGDFSAFLLWGLKGKDKYILDGYAKRVTFPELCTDLTNFYLSAKEKYGRLNTVSTVFVENKGSGISLIQQLRTKGLPLMELHPTATNKKTGKEEVADKYTRWLEVEADVASGYIHIPRTAPWMQEFLLQCEGFKGGKQDTHDDFVDCICFGIKQARATDRPNWDILRKGLQNAVF